MEEKDEGIKQKDIVACGGGFCKRDKEMLRR